MITYILQYQVKHVTKRSKKQKATATKLAEHGTTNIRAWFTASCPTQTPTETETLNTTETPI